jgi:methionine-rich copper-binding protein CopC
MKLRITAALAALFFLIFIVPTNVEANSFEVAPNAVSVVGTSPLQPDGNQISVVDPRGTAVDDGSVTVAESSVVVGLKPLTMAGVYTVTYTLLASGESPLSGTFSFLYNAPATMSSASPTPTPKKTISAEMKSANHAADIIVVVIFLTACIVAVFLFWYARQLIHQAKKKKRKARKKSAAPSSRKD